MLPEFLLELFAPDGTLYDLTDRLDRESLSVSLAVERNLHAFTAGDLQVTLEDGDGVVSGLFDGITSADTWRVRLSRDGKPFFLGIAVATDGIGTDRKQFTMELMAVDLSKALDDLQAETVARPSTAYALTATAGSGTNLLTMNTTDNLYNGDQLRLSLSLAIEEAEIALVLSATQVQLTENLTSSFTSASVVELLTPFYRFKTPEFLVDALLDSAATVISGRNVNLDGPPSRIPIFADQSTNLLDQVAVPTSLLQKDGKAFVGFAATSFEQATPDAAWASVATARNWIDWSPYRLQSEGEPATFADSPAGNPDEYGVDFTPGSLVAYFITSPGGNPRRLELQTYTSADGVTWAGPTLHVLLQTLGVGVAWVGWTGDYDPTRNRYYYAGRGDDGTLEFGYYDLTGASKVVLSAALHYIALRYSREADAMVALNATENRLEAWRDAAIIYQSPGYAIGIQAFGIKQARYLDGQWIWTGIDAAIPSVFYSKDSLLTVISIPLTSRLPSGSTTGQRASIVNGQFRVAINGMPSTGDAKAMYYVGAPFFAGVLPYADFSGMSVSEALDELAILMNGIFSVDREGVARFILRELDSGSASIALDDLVLERSDVPIWLETYDYVEVQTADGASGTAGQKTSISRNLEISTQIPISGGVATAVAHYLYDFFSKRRQAMDVELDDAEGLDLQLLDPVSLDGLDWQIYQVDRELADYRASAILIERVA